MHFCSKPSANSTKSFWENPKQSQIIYLPSLDKQSGWESPIKMCRQQNLWKLAYSAYSSFKTSGLQLCQNYIIGWLASNYKHTVPVHQIWTSCSAPLPIHLSNMYHRPTLWPTVWFTLNQNPVCLKMPPLKPRFETTMQEWMGGGEWFNLHHCSFFFWNFKHAEGRMYAICSPW